jgi:23S rRNA (uracil1939-C5)-methyltransferase
MSAAGLSLNDTVTCRIEKLVYGGDGLARIDGRVVFIPGTSVGETVCARITQVKPGFVRASLCEILEPAASRIAPCCSVADPATGASCRVPGCVYDHLDYAAELLAKQQQLEAFLARLPHAETTALLPPVASPATLHYRNKIVLHAVRDRSGAWLGYRQEPSHRILDIAECPLACNAINASLKELRASGFLASLPRETDITFRHTPHDGAVWWATRTASQQPCTDLLTEASPAGPLSVPRDGFYQVNPAVGDTLTRTVAAWFAESPASSELLDLYCGVGVFGLACMAVGGTRLTGVESGRDAVAAARLNAAARGFSATFVCHALGQEQVPLANLVGHPNRTTVIVDPPRDGMAPEMTRELAESGFARIYYISCDPATLARDLALLLAPGQYRLGRIRLFDMFPRTAHFESLIELVRQ